MVLSATTNPERRYHGMETALGVVLWAVIGWVVVRAVKKAQQGRAAARATAVANAASEGGRAGAHAETHIHLHIGQQGEGAPGVEVAADDEQAQLAAALVLVAAALDQSPPAPLAQLGRPALDTFPPPARRVEVTR